LALTTLAFAGSGNNAVPFVQLPLLPTAVKPGASSFTLTVNGSGFAPGAVLNWNGSPRVTTFISNTQVTAAILASDVASRGTASITVTNPAPGGGMSNVAYFSVTNQEPAVGLGVKGRFCNAGAVGEGDFNGDGILDLLTFYFNAVGVMLGNGDGTFRGAAYYKANSPMDVTVGDFNGDGYLDLAVANLTTYDISVYLGKGDGTFSYSSKVRTQSQPIYVKAADFNEDGFLDLVVMNSPGLDILFGNGDGTFRPYVSLGYESQDPMAIGDFNGDGHMDIAMSDWPTSSVWLLLGNGDGTFRPPIRTTIGGSGYLSAGDLNGDGKLDLVVAGMKEVTPLLGNGDGTFSPQIAQILPSGVYGLTLADFNADGKLDAAVTEPITLGTVLLGRGDGTFSQPINSYAYGSADAIVAGDFDGDGRMDMSNGCVLLQVATAVSLNAYSVTFPLQLFGTTSPVRQVKLTNSGAQPVSLTSILASGDFAQTNSCPDSLDVLKACTISITFTPTSAGLRTGAVTVSDNATGNPQIVELSGTGTDVTFSPVSIDFGSQQVGTTSQPQVITLTNVSTAIVNIFEITVKGPNKSDYAVTNTCGSTLGAGMSCTISVTFTPTVTGLSKAHVEIDDDGGGLQNVNLSGTGT
jgi:hypothetical protein